MSDRRNSRSSGLTIRPMRRSGKSSSFMRTGFFTFSADCAAVVGEGFCEYPGTDGDLVVVPLRSCRAWGIVNKPESCNLRRSRLAFATLRAPLGLFQDQIRQISLASWARSVPGLPARRDRRNPMSSGLTIRPTRRSGKSSSLMRTVFAPLSTCCTGGVCPGECSRADGVRGLWARRRLWHRHPGST